MWVVEIKTASLPADWKVTAVSSEPRVASFQTQRQVKRQKALSMKVNLHELVRLECRTREARLNSTADVDLDYERQANREVAKSMFDISGWGVSNLLQERMKEHLAVHYPNIQFWLLMC